MPAVARIESDSGRGQPEQDGEPQGLDPRLGDHHRSTYEATKQAPGPPSSRICQQSRCRRPVILKYSSTAAAAPRGKAFWPQELQTAPGNPRSTWG